MYYREVRQERTGWRDSELEQTLKDHNIDVPDSFLVTEYNYGKSVAIIEYKGSGSCIPDSRIVEYCKLRKNKEYYFIVRFSYEREKERYRIKKFSVYPGNDLAKQFLLDQYSANPKNCRCILNEKEFITFLYQIRNNTKSVYYQKAMDDYQEWFVLNQPYVNDRSIISSRHRNYAYDVPAADIDCMVCDENNIPYLFLEFKSRENGEINAFIKRYTEEKKLTQSARRKFRNRAIMDLGNSCVTQLPVFAVQYDWKQDLWETYAFNEEAENYDCSDKTQEEFFAYIKNPENFRNKMKLAS